MKHKKSLQHLEYVMGFFEICVRIFFVRKAGKRHFTTSLSVMFVWPTFGYFLLPESAGPPRAGRDGRRPGFGQWMGGGI